MWTGQSQLRSVAFCRASFPGIPSDIDEFSFGNSECRRFILANLFPFTLILREIAEKTALWTLIENMRVKREIFWKKKDYTPDKVKKYSSLPFEVFFFMKYHLILIYHKTSDIVATHKIDNQHQNPKDHNPFSSYIYTPSRPPFLPCAPVIGRSSSALIGWFLNGCFDILYTTIQL